MANKPGPKAPHGKPRVMQGTLRQKAWRAMQIKAKFGLAELCRAALTGEEAAKDPKGNIRHYVTALTRVGILVEMKRRMAPTSPSSNGEKRWILVQNLGRKAPVRRKNGDVFDPNTGKVFPVPRPVIGEEASDEQ